MFKNAKELLERTSPASETNRAIKALLVKTYGYKVASNNHLCRLSYCRSALSDYDYIVSNSNLVPISKGSPRGRRVTTDLAIDNAISTIIGNCATAAWSTRTHIIRRNVVVDNKKTLVIRDDDEQITVPAFHRTITRADMYQYHYKQFGFEGNYIKRTSFFALATLITRTENKSMRALDYNITDLLHEQNRRLSSIIKNLFDSSNKEECKKLIKLINDIYSTVQHQYPQAIGSTSKKSHNISFSVGNKDVDVHNGTCQYCDLILQFFKEYLPNAIDGSVGKYYSDIINYSFDKVFLFMGHALRCAAQNVRIKKLQKRSKGDTVVIIIDYMMKFEEYRQRESSRDHYGKRGLVVHGALIKYKSMEGSIHKRIYYTVPEGDGTQDTKAALANVDILCGVIKEDKIFEFIKYVIILSDNAGTYSSNIFHIAAFDIVESHGLRLVNIIHNEAQDGKTELDKSFHHFKQHLYKFTQYSKSSVLTPCDMINAMEYLDGIPNARFDIVSFNRPHLNKLFDENGEYYGKLIPRLKHVLPSHVTEVRTVDNVHKVYTSSAHDNSYDYKQGKVKKVNKWMEDHANEVQFGYKFFRRLVLENTNQNYDIPSKIEKE